MFINLKSDSQLVQPTVANHFFSLISSPAFICDNLSPTKGDYNFVFVFKILLTVYTFAIS